MIKKVKNLYEFLSDPNFCNKELALAILGAIRKRRKSHHQSDVSDAEILQELSKEEDDYFVPIYALLETSFQTPELALMAAERSQGWGGEGIKHTRPDLLRQHPEIALTAAKKGAGLDAFPPEFRTEEILFECFKARPQLTTEILIGESI